MAVDPRRRQKKLERKKARDKVRQQLARRSPSELLARIGQVAPVLHAKVHRDLWKTGMGNVLLSRQTSNGNVAFALFLVDVYCLGVKNVMHGITTLGEYRQRVLAPQLHATLVAKSPEYVRKLVEQAVAYAAEYGLAPHADYAKAQRIFGDIDPAGCREPFEFGHEGKPYFVSGPYDTPERCRRIVAALSETAGPGNFDYIVHIGDPGDLDSILFDEPVAEMLDEPDDDDCDVIDV